MNKTNESEFNKLKARLITNNKIFIKLVSDFEEDDIASYKTFHDIRHARKVCSESYLRFSQYIIDNAANKS